MGAVYWTFQHFLFAPLRITKAAITPGTQPKRVSMVTMIMEPHPQSKTAKGGKMMANMTLKHDMNTNLNDCRVQK